MLHRSPTGRRLWLPTNWNGNYRFPRLIADLLNTQLAAYRNRDAAYKLAVFLARFHAAPNTIGRAFVIDRRKLDHHEKLGLTEAQVRGAIKTLVKIGFMKGELQGPERELGKVNRSPVFYRFIGEFASLLTRFSRRAKSGSASSNKPISIKSYEVAHLGEKGLPSYSRRAAGSDRPRQLPDHPYLNALKPLQTQKEPDAIVYGRVEKDLVEAFGGYGSSALAYVIEHMTPEIVRGATEAERARRGSGRAYVLEALKRFA